MDIMHGMPRKLRFGQFTFKVRVCTAEENPDLVDAYGSTDFNEMAINLRSDIVQRAEPERLLNTMQHEVGHAINYVYGVTDESTEEQFVDLNTNGLIAFWLDNPRYETWRRRMLRLIKQGRKDD